MNFDSLLGGGLGNLPLLSNSLTRSISAENPTGEPSGGAHTDPRGVGPASRLGKGWSRGEATPHHAPAATADVAAITRLVCGTGYDGGAASSQLDGQAGVADRQIPTDVILRPPERRVGEGNPPRSASFGSKLPLAPGHHPPGDAL